MERSPTFKFHIGPRKVLLYTAILTAGSLLLVYAVLLYFWASGRLETYLFNVNHSALVTQVIVVLTQGSMIAVGAVVTYTVQTLATDDVIRRSERYSFPVITFGSLYS